MRRRMSLSTLAGVVDTRILGRPERFDGKDAGWYDFKFEFENHMGAVNSTVVEMMEVAAKQQDTIPMSVMTAQCSNQKQEFGQHSPLPLDNTCGVHGYNQRGP